MNNDEGINRSIVREGRMGMPTRWIACIGQGSEQEPLTPENIPGLSFGKILAAPLCYVCQKPLVDNVETDTEGSLQFLRHNTCPKPQTSNPESIA